MCGYIAFSLPHVVQSRDWGSGLTYAIYGIGYVITGEDVGTD